MKPTRFRLLQILCLGGVSSLVLGACSGSTTTTSTGLAADQTLKFPILSEVDTLDPAVTDAETDTELNQNMYDGLVKDDINLNVVPDIAAKLPDVSSDGLTYTFTLRKDVTFSNGDKVTSQDVLYSLNRAAALQGGSAYFLSPIVGYSTVAKNTKGGAALEQLLEAKDPSVSMSGLTAPDDFTVKMQLGSPAGWLLPALASPGQVGDIVDQKAVRQNPDNWWADPATAMGTGAYKMTSRIPKVSTDFAAVSNWWGSPKPTVTKIHIDVLPDASTAVAKYEQGGYDLYGFGGFSSAPLADLLRIQSTPNEKDQLLIRPKVRTTWVAFNMSSDPARLGKGPFTQQGGQSAHDLRLAFALAVDKQQLVKVVCGNGLLCSAETGGLITPGLFGNLVDNADP
jgi:ABC-type transport system substrate-binding protein